MTTQLSRSVQSYISTSLDPWVNLSIEHYLLQKSPIASTVLFLYVNGPSVVIGSNQNPWVEVDLAHLRQERANLVRRRSGGGTVFHDDGNVNWTVICPKESFTRMKHAEMVARALRNRGIQGARVNERHDIVLEGNPALKVTGSAYKLIRHRALHHGTCLLSSPNLDTISKILRSPAKPFIKSKGSESVRSPVGNVGLDHDAFVSAVQTEFAELYKGPAESEKVGQSWLDLEEVRKGYDELRSPEWMYLRTPKFEVSNAETGLNMQVHHGLVHDGYIGRSKLPEGLIGRRIHEVGMWPDDQHWDESARDVVSFLKRLMTV
ncbi:Lipoyltransferase and lipoate-protein ligase [Piedraia hortae CBS 480.64]|uniref:Putative lipoate-protein ligase A n=1 Tax=Piedraia hortae CBS 480.64 TaxID=1314780 RepID=A0A6A7C9U5_9PEZI|nr:Lipoyltransferase and lipoate-protein ligase [Piedraia hortae CBS 480.64]